MTDPRPPLTDDDLSAILDGEAGADVTARFQSDPAARDRFARLQEAREAVRQSIVPPLAPSVVDQLVARALDAGLGTATGPAAPPPPGVIAFPPRPSRSGPPRWLVAAVVVALVGIGVALVWSGTHQDDGQQDAGAKAPGTTLTIKQPAGTGDHGAAPEQTPAARVGDLGSFSTKEALRTSLTPGIPTDAEPVSRGDAPSAASVTRCSTQVATILSAEGVGETPVRTAVADIDGDQHLVFQFDYRAAGSKATGLVAIVEPTSCDPVLTFLID